MDIKVAKVPKELNKYELYGWEREILNEIDDIDILLDFIGSDKDRELREDFLHNLADVLFSFKQKLKERS